MTAKPRTIFEKVWDAHLVAPETEERPAILYIDLHLVHEVTSPQAFAELRARGLKVRRPDLTRGVADHSTPTTPPDRQGKRVFASPEAEHQVDAFYRNCEAFGVSYYGWDSGRRGIVHVIGPELGLTQPGMTIVCGDSHTSTHGAFGALAFGIGTTEVGHVLASQCLLQRQAKTMAVQVEGRLPAGVSAKDLILAIIAEIGADGGAGHVIEYCGAGVSALSMEERMTVCNMSIEAGARAGMIAPDETTFAWMRGREEAPEDAAWDNAVATWSKLASDADAAFDKEAIFDASLLAPMVTYGTNPSAAIPIGAAIPAPRNAADRAALNYMQLQAERPLAGERVDIVFIGSCTNARLSDLREACEILRGRMIAPHVRMLVAPGSDAVKRAAEAEGLHEIFLKAGAEWRESGCSMCIGMNGDLAPPGKRVVSTSNRNFEGRQGPGAQTILASPATAAASAVAGVVADPRSMLRRRT